MHPACRARFQLSQDIRDCAVGSKFGQQVNVIRSAIKRQRNSAQLPYRSADVVIKSNFIVRRDKRPPVFGRENEMVKKIGVRVGHAPSVTPLSMQIICKDYRPLREPASHERAQSARDHKSRSARSARQHKAWGEAKRTPGLGHTYVVEPANECAERT